MPSSSSARRPLHDLAIPPSLFPVVIESLGKCGCAEQARVVVEKPFGRDLLSAQELNRVLHSVFPENAVFRIDHYLGKEPVQNHLLEIVALSAMEAPIHGDKESVRDEKTKVLKSMKISGHHSVVRGQFEGYRDEDGVAPDSDVETFAALCFFIDSWRWAGVPFFGRQDSVEHQWRVTDQALAQSQPVEIDKPATWGPESAQWLIADFEGWRDPTAKS